MKAREQAIRPTFRVLVLAVAALGLGLAEAAAQNLFTDRSGWRPIGRPVDSTVAESAGGGLLAHGGQRPAEHAYGKPVALVGARLRLAFRFMADADGKSRVEFVFHGVQAADRRELRIAAAWKKSQLSVAGQTQEVFLSAELQGRFELEIAFDPEHAAVFWQGKEIARPPVRYSGERQTIGFVVTDADVALTGLTLVGGASAAARPLAPEEARTLAMTVTDRNLRRMPSSWKEYFGVHTGLRYYHGLIEALTNYPETLGRNFSTLRSCTNYADFQQQLALEKARPVRRGPFGDGESRVTLSDIGNNFNGRYYPLEETLPEVLRRETDMVFDCWKFVRPSDKPLDQNLLYWTMRLIHERFPEGKDRIVWQMGNEIQGPQFDYLGAKRPAAAEATPRAANTREGNLKERQTFYVDEFLAPSVEVAEKVAQDVYGDPRALKILLGSTVGHTEWLFEILERTFASPLAPSVQGDPVWKHIDIVCPHYTLGQPAGHADLQKIHDQYLKTGKIKGIWITESYGWAGNGPVSVIQQGFGFLGWAARNNLSAEQTRVIWWGLDVDKAGGSGLEFLNKLGAFMEGQLFCYGEQLDKGSALHLVANGVGVDISRLIVVISPTASDGAVGVGDVALDLPAGLAGRSWQAEGVQYSTLAFPENHSVTLKADGDRLLIRLGRRLSEPFVVYLRRDIP